MDFGTTEELPVIATILTVVCIARKIFHIQRSSWFLPRCMECRRGLVMRFMSVSPSVQHVHCDKMEEKSVQIIMPCERSFSLVF